MNYVHTVAKRDTKTVHLPEFVRGNVRIMKINVDIAVVTTPLSQNAVARTKLNPRQHQKNVKVPCFTLPPAIHEARVRQSL